MPQDSQGTVTSILRIDPAETEASSSGVSGLRTTTRWFLLSVLVGTIAGGGGIVFFELSELVFDNLMGRVAGYHPVKPRGEHAGGNLQTIFDYAAATIDPLWCLLLPGLGGLVVGWLVFTFAPAARGHGTDGAVDAYHRKRGRIPLRVVWVKTLASAITLGTGGSGGREGPIAQIGAGFGSWLAGILRLSNRERRVLLACGMGAGVAAIFRAPLAGALFAAEILYRDSEFESEVIMPSIVSCITSYSVFTLVMGGGTLFATDLIANATHFVSKSPIELLFFTALGLLLSGLVILYVKVFYGTESLFDQLPIKPVFRPMVGGLLTGGLVWLLFWLSNDGRTLNLLAFGYAAIQEPFDLPLGDGVMPVPWALVGMLVLVAVGKIVTTSLTIGSGGSAGVFGPSMVIGATAGAALGIVFHYTWPEIAPHPGAFAIVGMAGFFTGAAHVPISTLIMVSEITGNYSLLLPAMWVEAITFTLCRRVSLYQAQVPSRRDSPAHRGEYFSDVLEGIRVVDVKESMQPAETVRAETPLADLIALLRDTTSHYFPVVEGPKDRLVGIISTNDFRPYLHDEAVWGLLVATDIMTTTILTVKPSDNLHTVMRRFTQRNIDSIPVVDEDDPVRLLGMLRRREVLALYNQRLLAGKKEILEQA